MLKMRLMIAIVVLGLSLCGCSNENSGANSTKDGRKEENPNNPSSKPLLGEGAKGLDSAQGAEDGQQPLASPSRNELRVMSEQAKAAENEAKNAIGQFDANIDNPEARKEAEAKLKAVLPEYKEKMLQIGKAKLKETH